VQTEDEQEVSLNYTVKEIFKTIQGEGANAGRAAVFCRFSGCNLWSGRDKDRATAVCRFCDTEFVGGDRYFTDQLADEIAGCWGSGRDNRMVVFTGGEPLLQLDTGLIDRVKQHGFFVAVETNGTLPAPIGIDWLCVSPKSQAPIRNSHADELKLVFPQAGLDPERIRETISAGHWLIQPMDGPAFAQNTAAAVAYVKTHPWWRLSLQTHKFIGIP
jgi:7-carboxy-7-deazaguanine synthase